MTSWAGVRTGTLAVLVAASGLLYACSGPESNQASTTTSTTSSTIAGSSTSGISASPPSTSGGGQACGPPTLRVLSPSDGNRVRAPFPVRYEVRCFQFGLDGTIYLAVD